MTHICEVFVTREADFFVITIKGIGVTQAEDVGEIELAAKDYAAAVLEVAESDVEIRFVTS